MELNFLCIIDSRTASFASVIISSSLCQLIFLWSKTLLSFISMTEVKHDLINNINEHENKISVTFNVSKAVGAIGYQHATIANKTISVRL